MRILVAVRREDHAAADEADAGDDLGRDARRVDDHTAIGQHVHEAVFRDEHEQGRRDADQSIGSQTGGLLAYLPFKADQGGQYEGESQFL
jgi:hypothetical protein